MFCGIIDNDTGAMTYCQAGHPSPYLILNDGNAIPIGEGGFPVGMLPDVEFENSTGQLDIGTRMVILSDAALEAVNDNHEIFGTRRIEQALSKTHTTDLDEFPHIVSRVLAPWRGGRALDDDLTIVALKSPPPR